MIIMKDESPLMNDEDDDGDNIDHDMVILHDDILERLIICWRIHPLSFPFSRKYFLFMFDSKLLACRCLHFDM